jgi:hypothetical protein
MNPFERLPGAPLPVEKSREFIWKPIDGLEEGVTQRLAARLIDSVWLIGFPVFVGNMSVVASFPFWLGAGITWLLGMFLQSFLLSWLEWSPGKLLCMLRIKGLDFRAALLRELVLVGWWVPIMILIKLAPGEELEAPWYVLGVPVCLYGYLFLTNKLIKLVFGVEPGFYRMSLSG